MPFHWFLIKKICKAQIKHKKYMDDREIYWGLRWSEETIIWCIAGAAIGQSLILRNTNKSKEKLKNEAAS